EGKAMAQLRLESISDVLAPVTPLFDQAELFAMPLVPDVLAEGSVDGVIVLATVNIKKDSICHEVYRIEMAQDLIGTFQKDLQADYRQALIAFQAQLIGHNPQFVDNTTQYASTAEESSLTAAWQEAGNSQPQYLLTIAQVDDSGNLINAQPYLEQGRNIFYTLQGSPDIGGQLVTVGDDLDDCLGISVLITTPQVQTSSISVFAYNRASRIPVEFNEQVKKEIQEMGFSEWKANPDINPFIISLGVVNYDADVADNTNLNNIRTTATSEGLLGPNSNHQLLFNAISKNGETAAGKARNQKQAAQIRQHLSTAHPLSELENSSTIWDVPGTSTVLMLASDFPQFTGAVAVINNATGWSTVTPAALVSDFTADITLDDNGNVNKDAAYATAVKAMSDRGEVVKNIEIIGLTTDEAEAERQKAEVILAEMRTAGVADADTKIVTRVVKGREVTKLTKMATASNTGMIMTR
ncbi:MAG: hypothetical protein GY770_13200, partial [Aestuariibacter sp.]|nr:hypothetical protein [Aestuariibacter sp.]